MALLDVKDLLKEKMRQGSDEVHLEGHVVRGLFAEGADKVSKGGVQDYLEGSAKATQMATAQDISAEDALLAKQALKQLMDAKVEYGVDFFRTRR